jgi:1-acyl-sn-glycerol-3-phosphate acyltransferase
MSTRLRHFAETVAPCASLTPLGLMCLSLILFALSVWRVLPERFGAGARLACCIRYEPPRPMLTSAVEELARGGSVLLFPERTRTVESPIDPLKASAAIVAKHTTVPVPTPILEQGGAPLINRRSLFQHLSLPITCRVRPGRRVEPAQDSRVLNDGIGRYVLGQLAAALQNRWLGNRGAPRPEG